MEKKSYECVQKEEQIVLEDQDNFGQDGMRRLALNSGKYDVRRFNCRPLTPCHLRHKGHPTPCVLNNGLML